MGKISEQLIRKFENYRLDKIIDLSEFQYIKEFISELDSGLQKIRWDEEVDPSHSIYIQVQNVLSVFSEQASGLDEFDEYYRKLEEFDQAFMPSYPPMSPITVSYFTWFFLCDFRFGKHKETMSTIFRDLGLKFEYDALFLKAVDNLVDSSMRFYKNLGVKDNLLELVDIMTGAKVLCVNTSKYLGNPDEIWFVRLVPNLDLQYDYKVMLNTPYIVVKQNEKDWIDYYKRNGIRKNELGNDVKIRNHMKFHANHKYWHNYILDSYLNHESNCIYLTGIPDIKGSKPHEM